MSCPTWWTIIWFIATTTTWVMGPHNNDITMHPSCEYSSLDWMCLLDFNQVWICRLYTISKPRSDVVSRVRVPVGSDCGYCNIPRTDFENRHNFQGYVQFCVAKQSWEPCLTGKKEEIWIQRRFLQEKSATIFGDCNMISVSNHYGVCTPYPSASIGFDFFQGFL